MFPVNLQASISTIYRYRYHSNGSNDHINRRMGSEDQLNIFLIQKKIQSLHKQGNCAYNKETLLLSNASEIQGGYYN